MYTAIVATGKKLLVFALLLCACASAPSPTATTLPTATASATHTPSPTSTATPVPTPIGGSYPLLAVVRTNVEGDAAVSSIEIVELESERPVASIPLVESGTEYDASSGAFFSSVFAKPVLSFSPNGQSLVFHDVGPDGQSIIRYDLETGESATLFTLALDNWIEDLSWSPDGNWLSYLYSDGGALSKLGLYSFEDKLTRPVNSAYWAYWFSHANKLIYQTNSGDRIVLDADLNSEMPLRISEPSFSTLNDLHQSQISNSGCSLCLVPQVELVEQELLTADQTGYFYDLFDPNTQELVFSVSYTSSTPDLERLLGFRILNVMRFESDNFLFYVKERNLSGSLNRYSAWNVEANKELDLINPFFKLANTVPLATSPDGRSFIGLVLDEAGFLWSAAVFDLNSKQKLYEYRAVAGGSLVNDTDLRGIDVAWTK